MITGTVSAYVEGHGDFHASAEDYTLALSLSRKALLTLIVSFYEGTICGKGGRKSHWADTPKEVLALICACSDPVSVRNRVCSDPEV